VVKGSKPLLLIQQAGLLTAIPFVLLAGPVLGYYLGAAADRRWSISPWGMGIGILIGLLAGARVTIRMIRQAQELPQPHSDDRKQNQ